MGGREVSGWGLSGSAVRRPHSGYLSSPRDEIPYLSLYTTQTLSQPSHAHAVRPTTPPHPSNATMRCPQSALFGKQVVHGKLVVWVDRSSSTSERTTSPSFRSIGAGAGYDDGNFAPTCSRDSNGDAPRFIAVAAAYGCSADMRLLDLLHLRQPLRGDLNRTSPIPAPAFATLLCLAAASCWLSSMRPPLCAAFAAARFQHRRKRGQAHQLARHPAAATLRASFTFSATSHQSFP